MSCIISSADKKNTKAVTVPVDADVLLAQREKDLNSFILEKQQMDTLIKMIGKVTESMTGNYRRIRYCITNLNYVKLEFVMCIVSLSNMFFL